MKNKKLKFKKIILRILEEDNLQIIIGAIVLSGLFLYKRTDSFGFSDIFDLTLITSFVFLYVIKLLSHLLSRHLRNQLEDSFKLEKDYDKLVKKYPLEENFVIFDNEDCQFIDKVKRKTGCKAFEEEKIKYMFPVSIEYLVSNEDNGDIKEFDIEDKKNKWYTLPDIVKENYDSLFRAHSTSDIYNQINIRLNDVIVKEGSIKFFTSRTTYYDSLVTNRAMDYNFKKDITIRELFNPGPYIKPFIESEFSNHLGFNVFVETKDQHIIFVKRNMNVSIGKDTLGPSVAASLKTRYCLNEELIFTVDGLKNAVTKEMEDELGIKIENSEISIKNNLIAFYRDILEGGKPQLLFKVSIDKTTEEVQNIFNEYLKKKNEKYDTIKDGDKLVFINVNDTKKIFLAPDLICYDGKCYQALPSVSGTLAVYINYCRGMDHKGNKISIKQKSHN